MKIPPKRFNKKENLNNSVVIDIMNESDEENKRISKDKF
jgi:hypothetical protein